MSARNIITRIIIFSVLASGLAATANAEGSDIARALALVDEAREAFRVTTADDVAAARVEVLEKMDVLNGILDAAEAHGRDWKQYLLWDRLAVQVNGEREADTDELQEILKRFDGNYPGLELPAITRLGDALKQYHRRTLALSDGDLEEEFNGRLEQLKALVQLFSTNHEGEILQRISGQLTWFQQQEQIPAVVRAVRDLADAINLRLIVSRDLCAEITREPIDRVDPVTDCVLGTTVYGRSYLAGDLMVLPAPSERMVRLKTRMLGDADTVGRGYHGPVRAHVVGTAPVHATADILFGAKGFQVGPVSANVRVMAWPSSIWTTYNSRVVDGLVSRIARRRAARTQGLADDIASRHAEQRLRRQFSEELETRVSALQRAYLNHVRKPLLRHRTFPRIFRASSHKEGAQVEMLLGTAAQTGAPHPPPSVRSQAALLVQIHETAMNNVAQNVLAGHTADRAELHQFFSQLLADGSRQTAADEGDGFQMVLAEERPLTLAVDDSVLIIKVRARRFITSRSRYPAMNMTMQYKLQLADGGLRATRVGELEVLPPSFEEEGRQRLSAREIAARRFMTGVLERELPETYRFSELSFPKREGRAAGLVLTEIVADDGWLSIAAELAREPEEM